MLIDIFLMSGFCVILMAAVVFIKKLPTHELVKNQNDSKNR